MSPVLILGGGGHAKVVLDAVLASGFAVAGFLDRNPEIGSLLGMVQLGDADPATFDRFEPSQILLVNGFGGVGRKGVREDQYALWKSYGYTFVTVRHPGAIIASDVKLGEGAQVMAGAVLQPGVSVGENAIVNTRAAVDHDVRIGDHAHVAPGAVISGEVVIEEGAHVGTGAAIKQGVRIGRHSIVGVGSVVVRDVPDGVRVMGVPAHHNSKRIAPGD